MVIICAVFLEIPQVSCSGDMIMKFTDGNWLLREGVQAFYPIEARDIKISHDTLPVYAPTRRIIHRRDPLTGPLLTIELSSPLPDVIRVKLTHFAGQVPKLPQFVRVAGRGAPHVTTADDDAAAMLTSGRLAVRVPRTGPWRV